MKTTTVKMAALNVGDVVLLEGRLKATLREVGRYFIYNIEDGRKLTTELCGKITMEKVL